MVNKDKNKGVEDMETIKTNNKSNPIPKDLQEKLNKITLKAPLLKGKDNMIELNPNNPQHREWFEKDKYKGR